MKLTAESLDELYAEAEKDGDVDVRRIVETVERVEKDFTRSADAAKRGEARVDALVDKAIGKVTPTEVEPLPLPPDSPKTPTRSPLRSVSSLSDDAVVASEPNASRGGDFELSPRAGPLGQAVRHADRNLGRRTSSSTASAAARTQNFGKDGRDHVDRRGEWPPAQPGDDPKLHLDAASIDKVSVAALALGFHRYMEVPRRPVDALGTAADRLVCRLCRRSRLPSVGMSNGQV